MSYATTANRPDPVAAFGALGVPAAFGALLILGLAVNVVTEPDAKPVEGFNVPIDPPEVPPEPEPTSTTPSTSNPAPTTQPTVITPTRPDSPITIVTGPTAPIGTPQTVPGDFTLPIAPFQPPAPPPAPPAFDPVAASPKGNPGLWVTNNDYRTSWINRGYTGTASFTLAIDAGGRVSGCTITGSTGHGALDEATCRLLQKRARFEPARDTSGEKVAGTYRSSVRWTIPE